MRTHFDFTGQKGYSPDPCSVDMDSQGSPISPSPNGIPLTSSHCAVVKIPLLEGSDTIRFFLTSSLKTTISGSIRLLKVVIALGTLYSPNISGLFSISDVFRI